MALRGKQAFKNIIYMYSAQIVQLVLSLMMSIYVPMIIGLEEFSYWQLFIFYSTYVGMLHLGLNDGIYLKYGGTKPNASDRALISNQLWASITVQLAILFVIFLIMLTNRPEQDRLFVLISLLVYAVVGNIFNYCGSTLQALNKIKVYSFCVIIDKLFVVVSIFAITLCGTRAFQLLIVCFIVGKFLAAIIILSSNRDLFLQKIVINKRIFEEGYSNILSGSNLMLANIASSLIIGVGRFFIDINYPVMIFGVVSFAFTMVGFILLLLAQVGASVFPILKSKDATFVKELYPSINEILSIILPYSYLIYPILYVFVSKFLGQYTESLIYFVYLLPMCVFEAKTSMLYNTYLKVLRKERKLLVINLIAVAISFVLSITAIYVFNNLTLLVIFLSLSVIIRSYMLHSTICRSLELDFASTTPKCDILTTFACIIVFCYIKNLLYCSAILSLIMILNTIINYSRFKFQFNKVFKK